MKKITLDTVCKKMLADVFTPVGIYLRLRDRFRDTILLESTDSHASENSYSFICINAIGGIELCSKELIEYKIPGMHPERVPIHSEKDMMRTFSAFMNSFELTAKGEKPACFAQGLFGYTAYDAVSFFDSIQFRNKDTKEQRIPMVRYRLYQYVIVVNHFRDELFICENRVKGMEGEMNAVVSLIRNKDVPVYPFRVKGSEQSPLSNEQFIEMVEKGIASCLRGDVFQIVLSRRFQQEFTGDEFNVYRGLRNINPSPYLFYFDYGDYRLMGSSPEAQLIISKNCAVMHPIAGTFKRTGDEETDRAAAEKLLADPKENAEHIMLVDLARNDLSRVCDEVSVTQFRQVQYFSHVIHLVSEVRGSLPPGTDPYHLLGKTFPAGTLSGAPKFRAMELIDNYEPVSRGFYGGAIGFLGFDGSCNHAIMIRTFLSRNNTLTYQAGAGIVAASDPQTELQEVNNKLEALKKAILAAEDIE